MYLDTSVQDGHTADVLAASTHNQAGCGQTDSLSQQLMHICEPFAFQGQDLQASAVVNYRDGKYVCLPVLYLKIELCLT